MASVSQLEAMSFSVPVIISNKNGAACYVEDEKNGYYFLDNDEESLKQKLRNVLSDQKLLKKMGEESYRRVCEKYTFTNYYHAVMKIMQDNKMKR